MSDMIEIQPAKERRRAFATWAVAQVPKIRTIGPNLFAVPSNIFDGAPEDILIGSHVDGHRYVSPEEDAAREQPRLLDCGLYYEENGQEVHPHPECTAGTSELLGVATPGGLQEAVPGDALPEAPADAYGSDSTPLPGPDEGSDGSGQAGDKPVGVFPCHGCDREFTSERGRNTHARQVHQAESE